MCVEEYPGYLCTTLLSCFFQEEDEWVWCKGPRPTLDLQLLLLNVLAIQTNQRPSVLSSPPEKPTDLALHLTQTELQLPGCFS